ncbi:MAG: asparagine synthase (glutamine-hydrolyzing) [Pyrinomonadaceae bacterium]
MCGIAGIISQNKKIEKNLLRQMTDAIAYRGPDGDGHWINNVSNVGLGHRRLAIIDLSDGGRQPMFYGDGRYAITYNGEIYNYLELREGLEKSDFKFVSNSDTEVLLALYAERGEKCLEDVDGMFAFAIWDEQESTLFCARDRFGEKPFYYAVYDNAFYFASEMKALWAAGVPRTINNAMLYNYLTNNNMYNPADLTETFYQGIYKLKAAHQFLIAPDKLQPAQICYWKVDEKNINHDISEDEAIRQFRVLFNESVKRRLRSDVPVGSSLSGGLDSSLIVCTIDRLNHEKQIRQATFSARFKNFAKDEGKFMQVVIDRTRVEPHFVYPDDAGLAQNLERLFFHQEEPFGSASIYAQFCVMSLAKETGVTVLLDGQGADELLAGYHFYFDDYFRELKGRDKDLLQLEQKAYKKIYGDQNGGFDFKKFVSKVLPAGLKDKARKMRYNLRNNTEPFLDRSFQKEFSSESFAFQNQSRTLAESLLQSTFGGSLEELLRYADRNSMAHSREVRLPFLHYKLVEFLFSLPAHFKIRRGVTKYIMRAAFNDVLPPEILSRADKIGYEPPQKSWLANPQLNQAVLDAAKSLTEAHILDKNAVNLIESREDKTTIYNSLKWKALMAAQIFKN